MENYYYNHLSHMFEQDSLVYTIGVFNTMSHVHDDLEFGCVLQGTLQVKIGSQDYLIEEGGMFSVNAMEPHRYQAEEGYCICTFFALKKSFYQQVIPQNRQHNLHFIVEKPDSTCGLTKKIRTMFLAIYRNILLEEENFHLINQACISYTLCLINKIAEKTTHDPSITAEKPNSSKDITYYIMQNYKKEISIKTLAEHMHLSPDYTAHLFKQIFGTSFKQYINYMRVSQAQQLLLSSDDFTVTEILLDCGFNNHTSFIRAFKKFTGVTPSEYIVAHKKQDVRLMSYLESNSSLARNQVSPFPKNSPTFPLLLDNATPDGKYKTFSGTYINLSNDFKTEHLKKAYEYFTQSDIIDIGLYEQFSF